MDLIKNNGTLNRLSDSLELLYCDHFVVATLRGSTYEGRFNYVLRERIPNNFSFLLCKQIDWKTFLLQTRQRNIFLNDKYSFKSLWLSNERHLLVIRWRDLLRIQSDWLSWIRKKNVVVFYWFENILLRAWFKFVVVKQHRKADFGLHDTES